ncbi:bactofilin family protein [Falsirhodobacter xinxiangensis]|uniref:bactofilin family protein n=1 Tax=Falsirhodobacter xinxiangensis TaxID=2530049 RepID=UPI0010AAE32F|nr:polymer-forming cytoskeletal protein [Rhodobacter xinxiangensis]
MNTPADRPLGNAAKSVLSSDLRISGDITSEGAVEILGTVDGTVTARGLTVGPEGSVTATVSAEQVDVKGHLDGRVSCSELTLRGTARVTADITYKRVVIESGAQIEGRFTLDEK